MEAGELTALPEGVELAPLPTTSPQRGGSLSSAIGLSRAASTFATAGQFFPQHKAPDVATAAVPPALPAGPFCCPLLLCDLPAGCPRHRAALPPRSCERGRHKLHLCGVAAARRARPRP